MSNFYQELPEQWNNVKKLAVLMKQAVNPLQTAEVGMIRRKLASFDVRRSSNAFDYMLPHFIAGQATLVPGAISKVGSICI